MESAKDVEVESAEDYNDRGDILSEDGDEVGVLRLRCTIMKEAVVYSVALEME